MRALWSTAYAAVEGLPPGRCAMHTKSLNASSGFFVVYGGEGGIDSLRSPCGPPLAVPNAGVLSKPVEGSHPPGRCAMHSSLNASSGFVEYGGEGGIDSLRSPCGPPLAVQNAGVLSNPVEGSHPPGQCAMHTKSLNASSGFFVEYGGEGGIDSLRSPCGPPLAVQNAGVLSNPVEGSHPPGWCAMHTKSLNASSGFFVEYGGEEGFEPSIHFRVYTLSGVLLQPLGHLTIFFVAKSSLQRGATIGSRADPVKNNFCVFVRPLKPCALC